MSSRAALIILDGFGFRPEQLGNATVAADMPFYRGLLSRYPHTLIHASGEAVGLPTGQMGNSEVGHLNIGAGRVVYQDLVRISKALGEGSIAENETVNSFLAQVKPGRTLHLIGLLSDGGVHSHLEHLFGLIDYARSRGVKSIAVHAFLDGRDTPPRSGLGYIRQLQDFLASRPGVVLSSVIGRFFAMDRDKRWERVEKAYRLLVHGEGEVCPDVEAALERSYASNVTDEFMEPLKCSGTPNIACDDSVFCFNFRSDRVRELTQALALDADLPFATPVKIQRFLCLTEYSADFGLPVAFEQQPLADILGDVVSARGRTQLRIAETEKYAHVTFFFNGGVERQFPGEQRLLIPSPRQVRTYDEKPEMSAMEVADALCAHVRQQQPDLIILNFANPDMVGHTGIFEAAVAACEAVDRALEKVVNELLQHGYAVLITADHGNAEQMLDASGQPHTAHTSNPVPFIALTSQPCQLQQQGKLADIAPTLLYLMGIEKPAAMTGTPLLSL